MTDAVTGAMVAESDADDARLKEDQANAWMSDMVPMLLSTRNVWPPSPSNLIYEMFEDEDEIRVYAITAPGVTADTIREHVFPERCNRYRINKANPKPVYGVEQMVLETWIERIAEEWKVLDGETIEAAVEGELENVVEYLHSLEEGYRITDVISDLEEELHRVEADEEEEEEGDPKPAPKVENGASAVAQTAVAPQSETPTPAP